MKIVISKCKICKKDYEKKRQGQVVCSYECSLEYAKQQQIKKARKVKIEFKRNDKSELKKLAQQLINRYARIRDEKERGLKCCTCEHDKGQFDGGHFLPTSTYPSIRYNTNQIHLQCKNCNRFNGGKPKEYREFMIKKYGINYVEKLEEQHRVSRNYTVEYYQKLIRVVRKKIKTISNR